MIGRHADALVNSGEVHVTLGRVDQGIELIEQGIAKGGLKRAEDAKLHLGLAYLRNGNRDKAIETFKTVRGTDGSADLARLWGIRAARP